MFVLMMLLKEEEKFNEKFMKKTIKIDFFSFSPEGNATVPSEKLKENFGAVVWGNFLDKLLFMNKLQAVLCEFLILLHTSMLQVFIFQL